MGCRLMAIFHGYDVLSYFMLLFNVFIDLFALGC